MRPVRPAAPGFFPLDEELELLPGNLSPWLCENLTRLGSWIPFRRAAELLAALTGVTVSEDVARSRSEAAGAAQVTLQTAEVERLERETPSAPPGPAKQYLSADGVFVPLVRIFYKDTALMVTVGGCLCDKEVAALLRRRIRRDFRFLLPSGAAHPTLYPHST